MSITIAPAPAPVKPAALVAPVGALAGFDRWASDRMAAAPCPAPTAAEDDLADRLAWLADGGDPEAYPGPGWAADAPAYVPTPKQEAEERGYSIGVEGGWLSHADAFPGDAGAAYDGRGLAFVRGNRDGLRVHARRVGFDLGQFGLSEVRPATVSPVYRAEFAAGYAAGWAVYCERQRALADYFQRLDAERQQDERERDLEHQAREAGGWDRVSGRALV